MSETKNKAAKKVQNTETDKDFEQMKQNVIMLTPDVIQSIDVLIQCANIAQKGGLLSLQDASYANQAVMILGQFLPRPEQNVEVKPETTEEEAKPEEK